MENNKFKCAICGKEFEGYGNNPQPLLDYEQRVCDECNLRWVLFARSCSKFNEPTKRFILNTIKWQNEVAPFFLKLGKKAFKKYHEKCKNNQGE